jgi:hypothetical protein
MPREGQTGTLPDGTPVIFLGGQIHKMNEGGLAVMGGGYYESPQGRKYREGPKGGFTQVAGPTQAQVEDYSSRASQVNKALGKLDAVDQQLRRTKTIGPFGWATNPTDIASLSQMVRDLQLSLKEQPYNLGVLNGPDLQLLEQVVANPDQLKSAVFRQTLYPRLQNMAKILGDSYRGDMSSYQAIGGRPAAMPNLFRSPSSQYTAEEWGSQGVVPTLKSTSAGRPPIPRRPAGPAATDPRKMSDDDLKKALGLP